MSRTMWGIVLLALIAFILAFGVSYWIATRANTASIPKPVTVRESTTLQPINKTVPLKETHTENNHYYTQPCKLPDTGPTLRSHKAH